MPPGSGNPKKGLTTDATYVVAVDQDVVDARVVSEASQAARGRRLAVVTRPATVATWAAWRALYAEARLWAVEEDVEFWDGLAGVALRWTGDRFESTGQPSPHAVRAWDGARPVYFVEAEVVHALSAKMVGTLLDAVRTVLGASLAAGDVNQPGDEAEVDSRYLTDVAVGAAPEAIRVPVHGRFATGEVEVDPEPAGVVERIALVVATEPPADVCARLVRAGAQVATCVARPGDELGRLLPSAPLPEPLGLAVARSRVPALSPDAWAAAGSGGEVAGEAVLAWERPAGWGLPEAAAAYGAAYRLIAQSDTWPPPGVNEPGGTHAGPWGSSHRMDEEGRDA